METPTQTPNYQSYETTPQATGQAAATTQPPKKATDPVQRLIQVQEQNQELLQTIAANSELQLETIKTQGKYKIYGTIAKYVFYGIIAFWSLAMLPKLTQTITQQMLGGMGGNIASGGAVDPDNIQNILEGLDLNAILGN